MKTIGSFKLHKQGQEGIEISSEQLSRSIHVDNQEVFQDNVNTYRKNIVPPHITEAIGRLRYYFLNLTGHWIDLYNPYMDNDNRIIIPLPENPKRGHIYLKTLWQATEVTQVKFTSHSLQIMGTIDVIPGKPLPINPPKITHEDNLDWYMEAEAKIRAIFKLLVQYFSTIPLNNVDDYRKYLVANAKEETKIDIASFDDEQVMNKIIDKFSEAGAIVMMDGDVMRDAIGELTEKVNITEPTPDMEPEPQIEEVAYVPPIEKTPNPFGASTAMEGQSEVVDASLEFSDKMGSEDFEETEQLQTDDIPDEDFEV